MLRINKLTKSYEGKEIIKDLTISFPDSGFYAICGASGIGKSTLLSLISGILNPDKGSVDRSGAIVSMSFQEARLIPTLTAAQNVNLVIGGKKATLRKSEALLNELGITDTHAYPNELSGGMKARVSIARSLVYKAEIYLFDEPFANLDKDTARITAEVIKKHTDGALILAVMHDVDFARELADSVFLFDEELSLLK
jgi:ABC-type nitrate/sulfonate/bicarbonate transport system ATPase subunit